jgi:hypothetical protein
VLNDARHRNPLCASGSHQRVIDIDVNNHASEVASGVGERISSPMAAPPWPSNSEAVLWGRHSVKRRVRWLAWWRGKPTTTLPK